MYTVGQEVAVIRYGNWGGILQQGVYRVTKSNKVRVHLQRISDGYERVFSAKTGVEQGSTRYSSAGIISVERYNVIEAARLRKDTLHNAWNTVQEAVKNKDIAEIKAALDVLEAI